MLVYGYATPYILRATAVLAEYEKYSMDGDDFLIASENGRTEVSKFK